MENIVDKLQRLGLTEYEARVYLSLLNGDMNSASKLSERSDVPRTNIPCFKVFASKGSGFAFIQVLLCFLKRLIHMKFL